MSESTSRTDTTDNIVNPDETLTREPLPVMPAQTSSTRAPAPTPTQSQTHSQTSSVSDLTLVDAIKRITDYYSRSSKGIKFVAAHQITDSSVATFVCEQTGAVLASCKLRFYNAMLIDNTTNELLVKVRLSDLTFKPAQFVIN
mgnify:CR=1 FL=1